MLGAYFKNLVCRVRPSRSPREYSLSIRVVSQRGTAVLNLHVRMLLVRYTAIRMTWQPRRGGRNMKKSRMCQHYSLPVVHYIVLNLVLKYPVRTQLCTPYM
jgi:hypothetical protein